MLVGHSDLLVRRAIGQACQFLHVRHDPVVSGVKCADGVAKELSRGWNRLVEGFARREEVLGLCARVVER